jgi:hypothetical protein
MEAELLRNVYVTSSNNIYGWYSRYYLFYQTPVYMFS